jgi:hypothetical protein
MSEQTIKVIVEVEIRIKVKTISPYQQAALIEQKGQRGEQPQQGTTNNVGYNKKPWTHSRIKSQRCNNNWDRCNKQSLPNKPSYSNSKQQQQPYHKARFTK